MDVKYNMDTKVEDNTRLYKLQKSNFDREINTAVSYFSFFFFLQLFRHSSLISFSLSFTYSVITESRGSISIRTTSGQDSPKDPDGRDANNGCRTPEADRNRRAGDYATRKGADRHRSIARRGRKFQSRTRRSGPAVRNDSSSFLPFFSDGGLPKCWPKAELHSPARLQLALAASEWNVDATNLVITPSTVTRNDHAGL